ncbi:MAG: GH32 C-terminal domain-containing protein, partial [Maribacter sp.]
ALGDTLSIIMDAKNKRAMLDRSRSGLTAFSDTFVSGTQEMPMPHLPDGTVEVRVLIDHSSIELFVNQGQYVMTNQIFPKAFYATCTLQATSEQQVLIEDFREQKVGRIWE